MSKLCTYREHPHPGPCHYLLNEEAAPMDEAEDVRQQLRDLERRVAALRTDTRDRQIASRRIRDMIGDQLAELVWWRRTSSEEEVPEKKVQ